MGKRLDRSQVEIQFLQYGSQLSIKIITPSLVIRSVTKDDSNNYCKLFSNSDVMSKYANGVPISDSKKINTRLDGWVQRWSTNDPFNALAVFERNSSKFVGSVVIGRSNQTGIAELAYLFHKEFWGKGIATEAVSALINHFAVELIKREYMLDGDYLQAITATTRIDHIASQKILERDRKSTRLNSSHANNSNTVFCLKNKKSWLVV